MQRLIVEVKRVLSGLRRSPFQTTRPGEYVPGPFNSPTSRDYENMYCGIHCDISQFKLLLERNVLTVVVAVIIAFL